MTNILIASDKKTITIELEQDVILVLFPNNSLTIMQGNLVKTIQLPYWLGTAILLAAKLHKQENDMIELPDYGEKLTLREFTYSCRQGYFTDFDGTGYYASDTKMSGIPARPSDIIRGNIQKHFTHVIWFST